MLPEVPMRALDRSLALAAMLLALPLLGCGGDSSGPGGGCEIAFDSPDNSFIRVDNRLNRKVDASLSAHPIGALIDERTCNRIGVVAGVSDDITITECEADGSCSLSGRSRTLFFALESDETMTIVVDDDFFP
jgi:hypothetical protein